ncbi:MAG TPA: FAD-dependent oxidoreductase, partial [Rubellimicrobium sp.]|nr:FAD-dependent oxidoreductase [Rubellimicrobium sp.]
MTTTAQVVVIGGGITGCAIAWHLSKRGLTDVVLLERAELTAGSTWHAAGGFHTLNGASSMAALQGYTIGLYDELQSEADEALGLHKTGAIYLAGDDAWAEFLVVEQARALTAGVTLRDLTKAELREMAPIVDTDRVVHALFDAADGHLDPTGTTRAFASGARRRGVRIERHRPVTGLTRRPQGWTVETAQGPIRTETVVIAAGLWAREVAALAGFEVPVAPMEHQYLLTEAVPELVETPELPTIADFLSGSYLRREGAGLLYGTYEQRPRHWSLGGTPQDFGMDLLPPDLDRIAPNLERAAERIPCLSRVGLRRIVNGPLMVSPDGNPVVGPLAPGLFVAAGVLAGFSQCAGIGLALANWIADGEPGMDIWAMDIARFGRWTTSDVVRARTREVYERRYRLTKPNEHLDATRPLRTTPLYDRFTSAGAVWGAQAGWEYPTHFAPSGTPSEHPSWTRSDAFPFVREECLAVRDAAGLFETSAYAKFLVEGEGALPWLQGMSCNALPARNLRVGLMPLVSPSGRLAGDLTLTRLDDDRAILIGSPSAEALYERMLSAAPE